MAWFEIWVFHADVKRRKWLGVLGLALGLALVAAPTHAQSQAITKPTAAKAALPKKGPHGGKVQPAGDYKIELIVHDTGYKIYVLNQDNKPLSVRGTRAVTTILFKNGKKRMGTPNPGKDYFYFSESMLLRQEGDFSIGVGVKRGEQQLVAHFEHSWPATPAKKKK